MQGGSKQLIESNNREEEGKREVYRGRGIQLTEGYHL